jgi:hypothetical protein
MQAASSVVFTVDTVKSSSYEVADTFAQLYIYVSLLFASLNQRR